MTQITKLKRLERKSHYMMDKPSVTLKKGSLYFSSSAVDILEIGKYSNCYIFYIGEREILEVSTQEDSVLKCQKIEPKFKHGPGRLGIKGEVKNTINFDLTCPK